MPEAGLVRNQEAVIKFAYICEPQLGGTYTFFLRLRPGLSARGIDMRCVTTLTEEQLAASDFAADDAIECVGCDENDLPGSTSRLIDHLVASKYDVVMVLPGTDFLTANLPAYLPRQIRAVMRVPMMTRGAYAPTKAMAPHLDRIFAASPRIANDLADRYGVDASKVEIIHHGIDPAVYADALSAKSSDGAVTMLYAGRLWDTDKGVFLLPEIMRHLKQEGIDLHLVVAGSGPDEDELATKFQVAGVSDLVTMTGGLALNEMQDHFRRADIFVFPSRFEGFGFAVLEAMAAGCAPVVADIRGSLRVIVDDGRAGVLARVGDAQDFAKGIIRLARDREALRAAQESARQRVIDHYILETMVSAYVDSLQTLLSLPDDRMPVRSIEDYEIPRELKPTWRTLIPRPIKNTLRTWLERFGISS